MAGLDPSTPHPTEIKLHQTSRVLELAFSDGRAYRLPYEFLRVYSPSAEVRGHGPGQETLQTGKRDVTIKEVEPVGHYAIRPTFSDGHDWRRRPMRRGRSGWLRDEWRARRDSNPRPLASEASTLSI